MWKKTPKPEKAKLILSPPEPYRLADALEGSCRLITGTVALLFEFLWPVAILAFLAFLAGVRL